MKTCICTLFLLASVLCQGQDNPSALLDLLGQQYVAQKANHGLIIGVITGSRSQVWAYGQIEKGQGLTPRPDDVFELGDVSSVLTTALLMRLAHEKQVALDMSLDKILPAGQRIPVFLQLECQPAWPSSHEKTPLLACDPTSIDTPIGLTLYNLATSMAGLPPDFTFSWFEKRSKNPYADYHQEDLYRFLNNFPLRYTPGRSYSYSRIGMALLGHSLSLVAQKPYTVLLQEKILLPLSMNNTGVQPETGQGVSRLPGHTTRGRLAPYWETDIMTPAVGIRSTMNDMLLFLSALLEPTAQPWIKALQVAYEPRVSIPDSKGQINYAGYGWLITPITSEEDALVWQKGETSGFAAYVGFSPQAKVGVVVLANSANPVDALGQHLLQTLVKNQSQPSLLHTKIFN